MSERARGGGGWLVGVVQMGLGSGFSAPRVRQDGAMSIGRLGFIGDHNTALVRFDFLDSRCGIWFA